MLRRIQLSNYECCFICEGETDKPFYLRVVREFAPAGITWRLLDLKTLDPNAAGGKQALIQFHNFLASSGRLSTFIDDSAYLIAFFVDKDADDILGKPYRSGAIIYTREYCMENEMFRAGAIRLAAQIATGAADDMLDTVFGSDEADTLNRWYRYLEDWASDCLLFSKSNSGIRGFGLQWPLTRDLQTYQQPIAAKRQTLHRSAWQKSGLPTAKFDAHKRAADNIVARLRKRDKLGSVLNGKCLFQMMLAEIGGAEGRSIRLTDGSEKLIRGALLASLDTTRLTHYRDPVTTVFRCLRAFKNRKMATA